MHIPNPATFPHLDTSVHPRQPSWRTFSSQTSPSGTSFPMGGVLSMCPPHPLFIFQLLHIHAHPLRPTWPLPGLCAHLCTLLHTSAHLAHHFFLTLTPLPVPWHTSYSIPWPMGREILLSGQDSDLSSLGAYEGSALRGGDRGTRVHPAYHLLHQCSHPPSWGHSTSTSLLQHGVLSPHPRVSSLSKVPDRKSTRLNSSHQIISYAVFCLKKKKQEHNTKTHI